MLNVSQFRKYVVAPTLRVLKLHSLAAENLLIGTALVESNLTYLHQLGTGPALGLFQMEPNTHHDIWENFLKFKGELSHRVALLMVGGLSDEEQLTGNTYYAAAMCRVHYLRDPQPLPDARDYVGLAKLHKRCYNTALGATKLSESTPIFQRVVEAQGA